MVASSMIHSVRRLLDASHRVSPAPGMLDEGSRNGKIAKPTVRITLAIETPEAIDPISKSAMTVESARPARMKGLSAAERYGATVMNGSALPPARTVAETTALPEFYRAQIQRDLGAWWPALPEGGMAHDQNAYFNSPPAVPAKLKALRKRPSRKRL